MRAIFSAVLLLACACSPQAAQRAPAAADSGVVAPVQAGAHPVSGLQVVPLTIATPGRTHSFRVELARTAQEQQQGLMFRTKMGADEGMLFPSGDARMRSFWMRNTVIPLDLIFIGPDRRIINIAAMTTPYSLDPIESAAPAIAVLELNGGRAAELGIGPGARVEW